MGKTDLNMLKEKLSMAMLLFTSTQMRKISKYAILLPDLFCHIYAGQFFSNRVAERLDHYYSFTKVFYFPYT